MIQCFRLFEKVVCRSATQTWGRMQKRQRTEQMTAVGGNSSGFSAPPFLHIRRPARRFTDLLSFDSRVSRWVTDLWGQPTLSAERFPPALIQSVPVPSPHHTFSSRRTKATEPGMVCMWHGMLGCPILRILRFWDVTGEECRYTLAKTSHKAIFGAARREDTQKAWRQ